MCVWKEKKKRDREEGRGKIKPCFLLSHFQLCEVRATLQRSIELNFNPASSYTHLLYCTVKAVYPNFRHYHQLQPREKSRRRMDGSSLQYTEISQSHEWNCSDEPPGGAIISSCGHLNRKKDRKSCPDALQKSRLIHSSLSLIAPRRAARLHPPWGMWRCEAKLRRIYEQRGGLGMLRKIVISLKPPVAKAATCVVVSFDLREREKEREREEKKWRARFESAETKLPFTFAVQTLGLSHQHSALNIGTRAIHMRDTRNMHSQCRCTSYTWSTVMQKVW